MILFHSLQETSVYLNGCTTDILDFIANGDMFTIVQISLWLGDV